MFLIVRGETPVRYITCLGCIGVDRGQVLVSRFVQLPLLLLLLAVAAARGTVREMRTPPTTITEPPLLFDPLLPY